MATIENPGGVAVGLTSLTAQQRVSFFDQINLNVFWIANNFHWQALLAIVIPSMVVKFLGNANKDIDFTLVIVWGTLVALIVNPLVGALSDYATFRMGRSGSVSGRPSRRSDAARNSCSSAVHSLLSSSRRNGRIS